MDAAEMLVRYNASVRTQNKVKLRAPFILSVIVLHSYNPGDDTSFKLTHEIPTYRKVPGPGTTNPTNVYLFKVNRRSTSEISEVSSKLTIKRPERRHL